VVGIHAQTRHEFGVTSAGDLYLTVEQADRKASKQGSIRQALVIFALGRNLVHTAQQSMTVSRIPP
jgi:hypothetical protein